jgi:hypothetical protein
VVSTDQRVSWSGLTSGLRFWGMSQV